MPVHERVCIIIALFLPMLQIANNFRLVKIKMNGTRFVKQKLSTLLLIHPTRVHPPALQTHPYVYFNNMPESALAELPNLSLVLNKKWLYPSQGNLETFRVGSEGMYYFAKNKNWGDDLWEALVAPGE